MKTAAFQAELVRGRRTKQQDARKIIQLSAALDRLSQEEQSSIFHLGKVLDFLKTQPKFADYAQQLATIYDAVLRPRKDCTEDEMTCSAGFVAPTKLPMLRIDYKDITYDDYIALANLYVPIILTGAAEIDGRPGVPDWTFERIAQTCGHEEVGLQFKSIEFESEWAGIDEVTEKPLAHFIRDVQNQSLEKGWPDSLKDLYLHDWSLPYNCPELLDDYVVPKYFSLDYLQRTTDSSSHSDFWPSLFIGNKGTASGLHADWAATSAWMGLIKGRKLWAIGTPMDRPLYDESATDENKFAGNILEPDLETHPLQKYTLFYESILEAGEIIFIPAACPHQVKNLELIIAVAANLVDAANVQVFLSQLRDFRTLASGIEFNQYGELMEQLENEDKFPRYPATSGGDQDQDLREASFLFEQFKQQK